jgi:hypothetical protein
MKAAKSAGSASVWLASHPGSAVPSPKIAAGGAPQGDAVRFHPRTVEAERDINPRCASRRAASLTKRGRNDRHQPARRRGNNLSWLFEI